ncbi:hypothetical protein SLEP1_g60246, partial [Rubroshorea leprosula]
EFLKYNSPDIAPTNKTVVHIGWSPPPPGFLKLNTDGSAQGNPGMAGAGGIFRYHNGSWIYGYSRRVRFTTSLAVELWAIRDGLDIAVSRGISKLILETDSKVAEILLKSADHNFHSLGVLIHDCRRLMQGVPDFQIHHIYREANAAADFLAKLGVSSSFDFMLYDEKLIELSCILFYDCIGTVVPRTIVAV